jgi:hypothetical protein
VEPTALPLDDLLLVLAVLVGAALVALAIHRPDDLAAF